MKNYRSFITAILLLATLTCISQKKAAKQLYNADSLASGNYKDVLTSFFQLAIKNLSGADKDFSFSSNPYAIMLRADSSLAIDKLYKKYSYIRNLNFSFGTRLDSNYRLSGFSSGIKYAIVNKRDITISDAFIDAVRFDTKEFEILFQGIVQQTPVSTTDTSFSNRLNNEIPKLFYDSTFRFNQLSEDVKKLVMKVVSDSNLTAFLKMVKVDSKISVAKYMAERWDYFESSYQNKALWTIGISDTSYSNGRLFKTVELSSQFLKGVIHPSNAANLELDIKATLNYGDDSMRTGKKLDRQIFSFEPGVNLVLKGKNKQSYLEFKLSGSYNNIWKGLYAKETQIVNTINGTLRLRIFDELWLPLRITYDPKRGNVFGFLNVVTNFTGLGKFLNPKKPAL